MVRLNIVVVWATLIAVGVPAGASFAGSDKPLPDATRSAAGTSLTLEDSEQLQARIAKLIRQLGDDEYLVREAAQNELCRLGPDAFDAVTAAEHSDDVEIASRASYLAQRIRIEWVRESDSRQIREILGNYDRLDEASRLWKLEELAALSHDLGLPALCRLVRFEKSPLLSKHAALLILCQPELSARKWPSRAKSIEMNLAASTRPGALWLRAYLRYLREPEAGMADWDKLIDDEVAALKNVVSNRQNEISLDLEQRLVSFLEQKLRRRDRAIEILQTALSVQTGDSAALRELVDWFVQQEAWELVDLAAQQFAQSFNSDSILLYTSAHSRKMQGQIEVAERIAERAFKLIDKGTSNAEDHAQLAKELGHRGLFDASEREYRHVIDTTPPETRQHLQSQHRLSELLHDQQKDLAAAQALQALVDAMEHDKAVEQSVEQIGLVAGSIHSRMHFFYACDLNAQRKTDAAWKHLEEGLQYDAKDADLLIALFRSSTDHPERRKRAMEFIRAADERFRSEIAQQANDQELILQRYNEDAWLIGNTDGDMDLAIQYSQKSIELLRSLLKGVSPDLERLEEAGLVDTLAHCYAGKKDFESAVKYQSRAAELDPHALQIRRALQEFKAQLDLENKDSR